MPDSAKVVWMGADDPPEGLVAGVNGRWRLWGPAPGSAVAAHLAGALAVVFPEDVLAGDQADALLEAISEHAVIGLVTTNGSPRPLAEGLRRAGPLMQVPRDAPSGEWAGRLAAAAQLQPEIRRLRDELTAARQMIDGTGRRLDLLDEELRLAARLQRDFLPRRLPEVGPVRFGALFRPALFVSGDIYDVSRLDEAHVGFYVVDAVGHGLPAALLTMFIKRSLQTKRIRGNTYQIVPPNVSLAELNAAICEQNLSSCQFCTGIYAVLDTSTLRMTFARAGHPEPLLLRGDGDGDVVNLQASGSLLGVFPEASFELATAQLAPGDRLVLYTDGVEDALTAGGRAIGDVLSELRQAPRDEMLLRLTAELDLRADADREADDMTVLVVDVEADSC